MVGSVALGALGVLSYSASATFSATASATHASDTGDMELTLGSAGGVDNRLTIGASPLYPTFFAERQVKLTIDNEDGTMSDVKLTTTADNGPPTFVTDATNGLKLWIAKCSVAWTESGTSPNYSYTCSTAPGGQSDVLGTSGSPVPVIQTNATLSNLTMTDNADNYLRVKITLPSSAPTSMQNQTSNITFTFAGTQRLGVSK